jgi:hypothetical protein
MFMKARRFRELCGVYRYLPRKLPSASKNPTRKALPKVNAKNLGLFGGIQQIIVIPFGRKVANAVAK